MVCKESVRFSAFSDVRFFYILSPFSRYFLSWTNKQFVFLMELKIGNTNTPETMLTECIIALVFPATGGKVHAEKRDKR